MNFSTTEVFGFSAALIEFMRNSSDELSALGINVKAWIDELEKQQKTAVSLNDRQEKMKAALKDLTAQVHYAVSGLYDMSSSRLDAVTGAVGKKSELGKQVSKIRSRVKSKRKKPEETKG